MIKKNSKSLIGKILNISPTTVSKIEGDKKLSEPEKEPNAEPEITPPVVDETAEHARRGKARGEGRPQF